MRTANALMQTLNLTPKEVRLFGQNPHQLQNRIANLDTFEVRAPQILCRLKVLPTAISGTLIANVAGGASSVQRVYIERSQLTQA